MPSKRPEGKVDRLALAVARGSSLAAAARHLDVPESTARRWAAEPTFKPTVDGFRRQMISRAVGHLTRAANSAVMVLVKLLKSDDEDVRLKAARAVLSDLINVQSHTELADRIGALEAELSEMNEEEKPWVAGSTAG